MPEEEFVTIELRIATSEAIRWLRSMDEIARKERLSMSISGDKDKLAIVINKEGDSR